MKNPLISKLAKFSLVAIFLVVLAGSVVRMTGSGMGCPDWPKCFGYYIPPTERAQIVFQEGHAYSKGNIIIYNEALWLAREDFVSGEHFDQQHWEKYTRHDYAEFNAAHTWTEYFNRLTGAFSGVPVLLLFLASLFYLKRDVWLCVLSFITLVLLGFEGWLGKVVVDGNLIPHQITLHMFGALAIVLVLISIIVRTADTVMFPAGRSRSLVITFGVAIAFSLVQIYMGTIVRENVDLLNREAGLLRPEWIENLPLIFKFHRSFSIAVLLINIYLIFRTVRLKVLGRWPGVLALILLVEVLSGIILTYLDFPAGFQPVHLMLGFFLFATQYYLMLVYLRNTDRRPIAAPV